MKFVIVLYIAFFSSCNGNISPTNGFYNKAEKTEISTDSLEYRQNFNNQEAEVIKRIFLESIEADFKIVETESLLNRLKNSYTLSDPFSFSKNSEIIRVEWDEGKYWMDLVIYEFNSGKSEEAKEIIEADKTEGEILFGKDWDYIAGINSILVRVNSGCTLSKQKWEDFASKFHRELDIKFDINWEGYICICGLPCVKQE